MNFKYPISKEDSTDYNAEELYGILSREKSGHYLLGNHQFWHGGIHFSTETVEQCALKQPVRCIADGEVIAYRINKKYKESKLNTTTLQYSSSFCLVKHEYESPTEPIKTPEKDPSKLNDNWQNKKIETLATGFASYSDEAYSKDRKLMPKGLKLQILQVNNTTKKIGNTEYYLTKAKVLEAAEANATNKTSAYTKDEELWFAAFKKDGSLQSSAPQKTDLFKEIIPTPASTNTTETDKKASEDTTKPTTANKTNKLTFYSLYMHLLPYEEYPTSKDEIKRQAKVVTDGLRARDKIIDDKSTQVIGNISKGTLVNILEVREDEAGNNNCAKVTIAENSGKITLVNQQTKKAEEVTPPAEGFWIVLKDKQTNKGKITWRELAKELPLPKREYPSYWAKQVTAKVTLKEMNIRQAPEAGSDIAGATLAVKLKKDDEVTYSNSKVKSLKISGKTYRMAECKLTKNKTEFTEKGITTFWACVENNYMTTINAEPSTFDTIDASNKIKISAGEPVGYLGLYEVPASPTGGKSDKPKKQVHIEVFTLTEEAELKKFLDNEAGLTGGKQYIKIPKGTVLDKQQAEAAGATANALNSTWQNKETKTLANGFATYSSEALGATGKKRMPKGLKLKILQVKDTTNKIGNTNYYVAKAKVLEDIKADIKTTNDYKKDEEIWFAAFTADKKIIRSASQNTDLFEDVIPKPTETTKKDTPKTTEQLQEVYYKTQYDHIISPDSAKLVNNKYLVTLYENRQSITGCVAQNKIEKISQYELTKLGFTLIKEQNINADGSVSTTNTDGFIDQAKMTQFYQDLCNEMDSKENGGDGDGKLSLAELRSALKDPVLSEKWSKLIAYHPTEWQAKGDDPKWQRLASEILPGEANKALREHEKERITNLVFWDDVPDLKGKKGAFHFHPVAFVEHLKNNQDITTFHIYWGSEQDGLIEKHVVNNAKDKNKYLYVYHDRNNQTHQLGIFTVHTTKEMAIGNKALNSNIELIDVREFRDGYCSIDKKTKAKFMTFNSESNRWFINPECFAGLLGAMLDLNIDYLGFNGFSTSDAKSAGGSRSHINGVAGDLRYISTNRNGERTILQDSFFDFNKQTEFNTALYKYGWARTTLMYSEYFTYNKQENTLLVYTKHMRKDGAKGYRHYHHLHLCGFDSSRIKIIETEGNSAGNIGATKLSQAGRDLLKGIESLRLKPYDDQTSKEVTSYVEGATIGYGHLIERKEWDTYKNGLTKNEAEALFDDDLAPYENKVAATITRALDAHEFDALVLFAFNTGEPRNFPTTSVAKLINNPKATTPYKTLDEAWKAWNKSQGVVNNGLINRRAAELKIYHQNIYERW